MLDETDAKANRERLLAEQPKIDAALKLFMGYILASSRSSSIGSDSGNGNGNESSASVTWSSTNAMAVTRAVSKHINQHIVAINLSKRDVAFDLDAATSTTNTGSTPKEIVPQIWNELVASQQKPTKSLGRRSLMETWSDLDLPQALLQLPETNETNEKWNQSVEEYISLFYRLASTSPQHSDFALIWSADHGAAELERRALDRKARATKQQKQAAVSNDKAMSSTSNVRMEELKDDVA